MNLHEHVQQHAPIEGRAAAPLASDDVSWAGVQSDALMIGRNSGAGPFPEEMGHRAPFKEVKGRAEQTMSGGAEEAWNFSTHWDVKMRVSVDDQAGTVIGAVRLFSTASQAERSAWEQAIESRWSRRFDFVVASPELVGQARYVIKLDVQWVDDEKAAHHVIAPIDPLHPPPHRTVGVGGTVSMTEWGTGGASDVPHEFGHMLGNVDEYNRVNGRDYGQNRRHDGNIMNNPDNLPIAAHYEALRRAAAEVYGATDDQTSVRRTAGAPRPIGARPARTPAGVAAR